jgi:hypothetical protein
MKTFLKIIGVISIFLFLSFVTMTIFIGIQMGNKGNLNGFPPIYTLISLVLSGTLTKFISSLIWKKVK